jgi:hypothetical protein
MAVLKSARIAGRPLIRSPVPVRNTASGAYNAMTLSSCFSRQYFAHSPHTVESLVAIVDLAMGFSEGGLTD